MNIPNLLTLLRIALIPVLVLVYYLPFNWSHGLAALIFGAAALTDWLDGYLARALKQTSSLGAFLDPVADKLIVAVSLMLLVAEHTTLYLTLPALVIISREIMISALREWMAEMGKRASLAVSLIAKVKTTLQMLALTLLLWYQPGVSPLWFGIVGNIMLYLAAGLTLWSMGLYLKIAWPDLIQTA